MITKKPALTYCLCLLFTPSMSLAHLINFKQSVQIALANSPMLQKSQAYIDERKALLSHQRALTLPAFSLDMNAQRSNNALNVFSYKLSQRQVSFGDFGAQQYTGPSSVNIKPTALNYPGYYNNVDTGLVLNIPLFSGFSSIEKIKAANHLVDSSNQEYRLARQNLIYAVLEAYDGYLTATKIVHDAKAAKLAAKKYVELTRSLRAHSAVISGDLLLAETNVQVKQTALSNALLQQQRALKAFRVVINKPNSKFTPKNSVTRSINKNNPSSLEQRIFEENPKLQALESLRQASKANVSAARGSFFPRINLELRHDWNDKNLAFSNASNTAILSLNWPLVNFGIEHSSYQEAKAQYAASQAAVSSEQNQLLLTLTQLKESFKTAHTNYNLANRNIPLLKKVIQEYINRYGRGLLTIGQLLNVQTQLDNTKIERDMARYHMTLANAKLLVLLNKLKA